MSLRDRQADVNLRVAEDRSGFLSFNFCFASLPPLPLRGMKGAVYTTSGGPTLGRAGAFVLNYSDKKRSIPAGHTSPHA